MKHRFTKPTRNQLELLALAINTEDGNPWSKIGIRSRAGGAIQRMFDDMQSRGMFDDNNCITALGRRTFLHYASRQKITVGLAQYQRMIFYPAEVTDGTVRCFACGQIDEPDIHDMAICLAAHNTDGFVLPPDKWLEYQR